MLGEPGPLHSVTFIHHNEVSRNGSHLGNRECGGLGEMNVLI